MSKLVRMTMTLLLFAGASVGLADPAAAGVPQYTPTVTKPYVTNWVVRSTALHACMFIGVSGNLVAKRRYAYYAAGGGGWDPNYYVWSHLRLANPVVSMQTGSLAGAGCDFTRRVALSTATLVQQWYEGSCRLSAQVSAGAPWSVQVTPTYSCRTHRVASRSTTYGTAASFAQYNSGYPASFSGEILARRGDAIPVRGNVTVTGYRTIRGVATSDTFATKSAIAYMR